MCGPSFLLKQEMAALAVWQRAYLVWQKSPADQSGEKRRGTMARNKKKAPEFVNVVPVRTAFAKGNAAVKMSAVMMGAGNFAYRQPIQGLLFLATEVAYILYMILFGIQSIQNFITLGTKTQEKVFNETKQVFEYLPGDNSQLCLLYGVVTLFVTLGFFIIWRAAIRSAYRAQCDTVRYGRAKTFSEILKELRNAKLHNLLMTGPVMGIIVFTIMPLIFMILMAFTNYDRNHLPPGNLFDWVGLENFSRIFGTNGDLGATFWPVLGWTLIWAVFATFLNYFFGMLLAIVINRKETRLKGMWRFFFVLTIAIPQFVSLLVMRTMLQEHGAFNLVLKELFNIGPLPFLSNATWARVTVIIVNLWVGIPYTLVSVTGILQNIPAELYESAKLDGASPFRTFIDITLPYMMFVMTPQLIVTFSQNVNNFNVIFLVTNGDPACDTYYRGTAGKTDLLITWLYKLTIDNKDFNLGAVIGILCFVILATLSLITYRRTGSYKNEEEFS